MDITQRNTVPDQKSLDASFYIVALVDILGQREALQRFKGLPDDIDPTQKQEFLRLLKETYGVVTGTQKTFFQYFESYSKTEAPAPPLPADQMALYKTCKGNEIRMQRFSDGIVVFTSLAETEEIKSPVKSVHGVLIGYASMFLLWLQGRPLRGAIEIGLGWEANEGEIYGPALSEAYGLEKEVARYPRIVIGDQVLQYLDHIESRPGNDPITAVNKFFVERCRELIARDVDGRPILDYLGRGFRNQTGSQFGTQDFLNIERYVIDQQNIWMQARETERAFRYSLLKNYVDARRSLWV